MARGPLCRLEQCRVVCGVSRQKRSAGIGLFGGTVDLATSTLDCNAIHLDGEYDYALNDLGGNRCGCGEVEEPCKVLSSSLKPPDPLL